MHSQQEPMSPEDILGNLPTPHELYRSLSGTWREKMDAAVVCDEYGAHVRLTEDEREHPDQDGHRQGCLDHAPPDDAV